MVLTDEKQKYNPKPITIKTEGKHTIPAQSTRIIYASILVSNDHPITGITQPLPQFDVCAKLIVAPAITTARDTKVAIKSANTTDFPYTVSTESELAELQILKPEKKENDSSGRHSSTQPINGTRRCCDIHQRTCASCK